jgi:hypothetical protein
MMTELSLRRTSRAKLFGTSKFRVGIVLLEVVTCLKSAINKSSEMISELYFD